MAKREKRASWFKLFLHQKVLFDAVPDETAGRVIKAALAYFESGQLPALGPLENVIFSSIKPYVDESVSNYLQDVSNGKKGGRPKTKPPVTTDKGELVYLTQAEAEAEAEAETEKEKECVY